MFQEQTPSCVLVGVLTRERVSGACFRIKLPRVYWLGFLPGSVFQERVSGANSLVCTGWGSYPRACFGSVFQEQAPSCALKFSLRERVSGANSLVCTGWGPYPGACFRSKLPRVYWLGFLPGSVFQEQAPSCALIGVLTRERVSGACFRSKLPRVYWLGFLPGSVFQERVSRANSLVCTGWGSYPRACFGSVFQEQAPSCVPAFIHNLSSCEIKAPPPPSPAQEKKDSSLKRIRTHGLCDTGKAPQQLSCSHIFSCSSNFGSFMCSLVKVIVNVFC